MTTFTQLGLGDQTFVDVADLCKGMLGLRDACKRGQADMPCLPIERAFSDL